jgi:hypothetical protein
LRAVGGEDVLAAGVGDRDPDGDVVGDLAGEQLGDAARFGDVQQRVSEQVDLAGGGAEHRVPIRGAGIGASGERGDDLVSRAALRFAAGVRPQVVLVATKRAGDDGAVAGVGEAPFEPSAGGLYVDAGEVCELVEVEL